ncbi:MAG: hypothetical protein XD95_0415 [Microgenomates bacterium 39_7]|nr:MAG: hypothetical protein XD95_0415 [Microgenomates bacterium 39_7]
MPKIPESNFYFEARLTQEKLAEKHRQTAREEGRLAGTPEEFCEEGVECTIKLPDGWIEYIDDNGIKIVPEEMVTESGDLSDENPFLKIQRPTRPIEARTGNGDLYSEVIATYCFDCEGWVEGEAYSEDYRDVEFLSGSEGTEYHCTACGEVVAKHIRSQY